MILITFTLILGATIAYCVWLEIRKWQLGCTKLKAFSKITGLPILGVGGRFIGQNNEEVMRTLDHLYYEAKPPFQAWLGPALIVGISDPEDMQTILNADQCLDKPYMYRFLRNITGLLASRREIWKQHRKALNPTFSTKVINSFIPIFNVKAKILADQMDKNVGTSFDIYRPIFKALTDTIVNTALGTKWELQTSHGDNLHDTFIEVMNYFQRRVVRFWLKWEFTYSLTKEYTREMALLERGYRFLRSIRETKEIEIKDKLEKGDDILEKAKDDNLLTWIQKCFMLYRDGVFTDQQLIEEIDTIFVGGTDTTTVTISSALIMLAIYPEYQDKVVAELHEVFDNPDAPITYEDISKLTYMEMVIKESLRHFPVRTLLCIGLLLCTSLIVYSHLLQVGPFIARECTEDLEFRGGVIPKDAIVVLNIAKMHKDPKYWGEQADSFYPDHFLPENFSKMHPYTFLAFSGGPRNCIGKIVSDFY